MGQKRPNPSAESAQPAKKKKKTSATPVVESEPKEEAFPRGGKSLLTPLEVKKIHEEVKRDLFSGKVSTSASSEGDKDKKKKKPASATGKPKAPAKKKEKVEEEEDTDDSLDGILRRLDRDAPKQAVPITFNVRFFRLFGCA
jgi:rRNA biogenesis protein RRP5